jgi:hypothetical protein
LRALLEAADKVATPLEYLLANIDREAALEAAC